MKKSLFFFMMSALALTSGFGLTACSSSNEVEEVDNPNYDPKSKTVNANFVFSVSTGNTAAATRQSAGNTQATVQQAFRGIEDAQLAAFMLPTNGDHVTTASEASKIYELGTVLDANKLDPDGAGLNDNGEGVPLSHRVLELSLPTETNTLLFWGKAIKDGTSAAQGEIAFNVSNTDISKHYFSLTPRISNSSTSTKGKDAFAQYESIITTVLNTIAKAGIADQDVTFDSKTKHIASLSWSDYADLKKSPIEQKTKDPADPSSEVAMSSLGGNLAEAFVAFHNINAGEVRAGSGSAVATTMTDLYKIIGSVADAKPSSIYDAVAQQVAIAVRSSIERFFSKTEPAWLKVDAVLANPEFNNAVVNLVTADSKSDLNQFPANFGVPAGVTQLTFSSSTGQWGYDDSSSSMIGSGAVNVFSYMYPAELCYFGNSPVRVSTESKTPSQYPDGVAAWENDNSWTGWTKNGRVQPDTRSVAMQDNINYGTALLESTVRYGSEFLEDNNHAIQKAKNPALADNEEPNNKIQPTATAFMLTGIIIGGQPQTVGWDYLAKDGISSSFNYLVYDNALPNEMIPAYTAGGSKSTPNYTLVWDNWSETLRDQDQSPVYVALEFVNNTGKEFFGRDNKIPNGATFYIVGKLDPDKKPADRRDITDEAYKADKSLGITWPTDYALPPYDRDGSTLKQRRVFMQDYMTTANFVLNKESLQRAYVSVPDLRSLQISLGMSVDVQWRTGLAFEVPLGE